MPGAAASTVAMRRPAHEVRRDRTRHELEHHGQGKQGDRPGTVEAEHGPARHQQQPERKKVQKIEKALLAKIQDIASQASNQWKPASSPPDASRIESLR